MNEPKRGAARRVAVALVVVVGAVGAACGGGKGTTAARPSGAPSLPPLLSYVPADAGLVAHLPPGAAELLAGLGGGANQLREMSADADEAEREGDRMRASFLRQLAAGDGSVTRTLGWRPGTSEVVAWAQGDTLVVRARLDGAALRASVERAATEAGEPLTRRTAGGHTYVAWSVDDGREVLARTTADELVLVWTSAPARDVAVLMNDRPPATAFDGRRIVRQVFPDGADAHLALRFDPRWLVTLIGDQWGDMEAACGSALRTTIAGLPAVHVAWARLQGETEVATAVELSADTAARLERGVRPVPRWATGDDVATLGMGLSLATASEVLVDWLAELEPAISACGGNPGMLAGVRMFAAMPLVRGLERAGMIFDPAAKRFALAVTPTAVDAYWNALASFGGLPPTPPVLGERRDVDDGMVASDGTSLYLASAGADAMLDRLMAAGPGPRAIFALAAPTSLLPAFADEDDDEADREGMREVARLFTHLRFEVGLRGRLLTWRWGLRHR